MELTDQMVSTPVIGVKQDTDGIWYWTLDGEWLIDDAGNKIPTTGKDGADGEDGKDGANGTDGKDGADGEDGLDGADGITPQLKIEDGYWYLSYDNGATWQQLGKATGDNGLDGSDGEDGDSIINSITQDEYTVTFTLSDGKIIQFAKYNNDIIQFADYRIKMICVSNWDTDGDFELSKEEASKVETIGKIFSEDTDIFLFNELKYFIGLNEIEESAFSNCTSLISIHIPDNVKIIQAKAFWKCSKLSNISFGDSSSLISINGGVEDVYSSGYLYTQSTGAFAYCNSLKSITLPSTLQTIETGAFYECTDLTEVEFQTHSSLKAICSAETMYRTKSNPSTNDDYSAFGAFSRTGVKSIKIPSSLTTLSAGAFSKSRLESITFESGIDLKNISGRAATGGIYYEGAFSDCICLKSVTIPASVEEISIAAFKGCILLEEVAFEPNSKLNIIRGIFATANSCDKDTSHGAFTNCTSLSSISIPNSVTTLEVGVFEGCSNLQSVEFIGPSSINSIKGERCRHSGSGYGGAFKDCIALEEIKITNSTPPSVSEYAFRNVTLANITLKVPYGSADAYKAASYWKNMTIKEFYE